MPDSQSALNITHMITAGIAVERGPNGGFIFRGIPGQANIGWAPTESAAWRSAWIALYRSKEGV